MRELTTRLGSLSVTYKSLKTGQPSYLRSLRSFSSHHCTQSSSLITLSRPALTSHLKIADRSYHHSALGLWNNLPSDVRHVAHHVVPPIFFIYSIFYILRFVCSFKLSFSQEVENLSLFLPFLLSLYSPRLSRD